MQLGGNLGVAVVVSVSKIGDNPPALMVFCFIWVFLFLHTQLSGCIGAARNQWAQKWTENIKYPSAGKKCSQLHLGFNFPTIWE